CTLVRVRRPMVFIASRYLQYIALPRENRERGYSGTDCGFVPSPPHQTLTYPCREKNNPCSAQQICCRSQERLSHCEKRPIIFALTQDKRHGDQRKGKIRIQS